MPLSQKLRAYLQLMRPANIVTAIADILAGAAASGSILLITNGEAAGGDDSSLINLLWLVVATIGLYGGGVVFNDVFDAKLDREERPERPIPRGDVSVTEGAILGGVLLVGGILSALQVSIKSFIIAVAVALCALLYDAWGKHQRIFGPINMGLCRGGNLLLGVSLVPAAIADYWYLSLIPIVYIAAITMVSRGEVHGSSRSALWGGVGMYSAVIVSLAVVAFREEAHWSALLFLGLFASQIYPPLFKAIRYAEPQFIGKAVKAGVISLIILNATFVSIFASALFGLLVLLLLPLSIGLARYFAVT
ncbi:MAG: UbiA-like protein EboC [Tunicatimonas sp.]|uniref:UbiA-like protein EboC n=1 Tax=Tunicatimonas sp. TaxID=1940096 RepID=UPI003C70DA39